MFFLHRLAICRKNFNEKPDVVVESGTVHYEGSGGNQYYIFKSDEIERIIDVNVITEFNNKGTLVIKKNNKVIEEHDLW